LLVLSFLSLAFLNIIKSIYIVNKIEPSTWGYSHDVVVVE